MPLTERLAEYDNPNQFALLQGVTGVEADQNRIATTGRECFAFSPREDAAAAAVVNLVRSLFEKNEVSPDKYNITVDAIGNVFVTWYGEDRTKTFMSGSHLDSVLGGGVFDGPSGINSAYTFLQKLVLSNALPDTSFTMVAWRSEESSPTTGSVSIGSRAATGTISKEDLEKVPYMFPGQPRRLLKEHITETRGAAAWDKIIAELTTHPFFSKMEVVGANELHIEQSAVIDRQNKEVGIVVHGIGGAIRQELAMQTATDKTTITPANPHTYFTLTFTGEQAHTGGTPPNLSAQIVDGKPGDPWYRKDALIGSSQVLKQLFWATDRMTMKDAIKVTSTTPARMTGFTTVPDEQIVQLAVEDRNLATLETIFNTAASETLRRLGVTMRITKGTAVTEGDLHHLNRETLKTQLELPLQVETFVRKAVNEQKTADPTNSVGTLRATVTDFSVKANGLTEQAPLAAKLDLRDVDPTGMAALEEKIALTIGCISRTTGSELNCKTLSRKPFAPIDATAASDLMSVCDQLGVTYTTMPSMPGHDGASLAARGVPISMVFVRHDGVSHNPAENQPLKCYQTAERVQHEFMAERIGFAMVE